MGRSEKRRVLADCSRRSMDVAVRVALMLSRYISEWYWRAEYEASPRAARQAHFALTEAMSDEFVLVIFCVGLACIAGLSFTFGMSLG